MCFFNILNLLEVVTLSGWHSLQVVTGDAQKANPTRVAFVRAAVSINGSILWCKNLADLMIEHGVGVRTSRAIEFKRLDEDFFSEDD
jgi:hypothetical protein